MDDAAALVARHHYKGALPTSASMVFVGTFHREGGLFGECGDAVAACLFSHPAARWAEPVLELTRLVRTPAERVPLSRLIKLCCVYLKRAAEFDLLVSFADWTHGHHGGVYQSASWNYHGQRDRRMDGLLIDGQLVAGRNCNHAYGTQSPEKVAAILGASATVAPHYDEGKHLYWKALNEAGAAKARRLGLKRTAYPKPAA